MTEPRIQYAQAKDGVSIAYATTGQGPPLVVCPAGWQQFSLYRQVPSFNALMERLGKGRLLVEFDGRGSGLSERNVKAFSLEARLRDLEAVVRAVRIKRFALYAPFSGWSCRYRICGPPSTTGQAAHPVRDVQRQCRRDALGTAQPAHRTLS